MAKRQIATIIEGGAIKSSLLYDEDTDAWSYHSGAPDNAASTLYRSIPTLYRGVRLNANAAQNMPWVLRKGKREVTNSQDFDKSAMPAITNPRRFLDLTVQSLQTHGRAYWLKETNAAGYVKDLRYMAAGTVEPVITDEGLTGFKRSAGARTYTYTPEQVCYFWLPDADVEVGPPQSYPLQAAAQAARVLHHLDGYIATYFERGAIRPIIVTAKGMPSAQERERLDMWFNRLMSGIKRAFTWKVFNADTVSVQQVGDGLDQLQNQTLTADQRQDVALALGIPQTILFANSANFATSMSDRRNWYDATVVPLCEFVSEVINDQIMAAYGMRFEFAPETLDVYQEDEKDRSGAVTAYVNAGMPLLMALQVCGVELTDEQRAQLESMEAEPDPEPQAPAQLPAPTPTPESPAPDDAEAAAEVKRWKRAALQAMRKGAPLPVDWIPEAIDQDKAAAIKSGLALAHDAAGVAAAFGARDDQSADLAEELRRANDMLAAVTA